MEAGRETQRASGLEEVAELLGKRLTTSLVLAAGIIGLAIYARPGPPRYQIVTQGAQVIRVDTRNGSMISCDTSGCYRVHKPGGRIQPGSKAPALAPVPAPAAALPAPAAKAGATPPAAPQAPKAP